MVKESTTFPISDLPINGMPRFCSFSRSINSYSCPTDLKQLAQTKLSSLKYLFLESLFKSVSEPGNNYGNFPARGSLRQLIMVSREDFKSTGRSVKGTQLGSIFISGTNGLFLQPMIQTKAVVKQPS